MNITKAGKTYLSVLLLSFVFVPYINAQTKYAPKTPKNIIIVISDGCGINHIEATNYYNNGKAESSVYQSFPHSYWMATFPQKGPYHDGDPLWDNGYNSYKAWTDFEYVKQRPTGSAPAATAMATGKKTYMRSIGIGVNGEALYNITQRAKDLGKSAGIVTSVQLSHATPAGYVAHNANRGNYSEIAREMILDSRLDVIMGCGHPLYDNDNQLTDSINYKYVGGKESWEGLESGSISYKIASNSGNEKVRDCDGDGRPDPWRLIDDRADFEKLTDGETPKRVFGVARCFETLQYDRSGDTKADAYTVPFNDGVPSLKIMAKAALNVLDNNEKGFFLMVEGGAVDWAGHDNNSGRLIEEQSDLNETVEAIIEWVDTHGGWDETLLVVTADHETGYLTGPGSGPGAIPFDTAHPPVWNEITDNGKGKMPGMEWHSDSHTNQLVPFYAKGCDSKIFEKYLDEFDHKHGAYLQNTELGMAQFELWPLPGEITIPENIIVFISDGWGINKINAANYFHGETQAYQEFPLSIYMSTYPAYSNRIINPQTDITLTNNGWDVWYNPYVNWNSNWNAMSKGATGSGAAATAMACGVKSSYKSIGVNIYHDLLPNITERAKSLGKSAGVVTSVQFSHATPAAYVAHNTYRNNYSAIAQEMILDSRLDLIMGCGHPLYDNERRLIDTPDYNYVGGKAMWEHLTAGNIEFSGLNRDNRGRIAPSQNTTVKDCDGDENPDAWKLLQSVEDFRKLMNGETPKRVIGVPQVHKTLQCDRSGDNQNTKAYEVPLNEGVPTLEEMTRGALNVLDNNEKGFFLMVEGGAVDWAGHDNSSPRVIEEQQDFNKAVNAAIEWVNENGGWEKTLIIVTGDHETGYLTGKSANPNGWNPVIDNGKGNMPTMTWNSGSHTNQLIPFFAKGASFEIFKRYADQTDERRGEYLTNSELGQACFYLWGRLITKGQKVKN